MSEKQQSAQPAVVRDDPTKVSKPPRDDPTRITKKERTPAQLANDRRLGNLSKERKEERLKEIEEKIK